MKMKSIQEKYNNAAAHYQQATKLHQETEQNYKWVGVIIMAALVYDYTRKKRK